MCFNPTWVPTDEARELMASLDRLNDWIINEIAFFQKDSKISEEIVRKRYKLPLNGWGEIMKREYKIFLIASGYFIVFILTFVLMGGLDDLLQFTRESYDNLEEIILILITKLREALLWAHI